MLEQVLPEAGLVVELDVAVDYDRADWLYYFAEHGEQTRQFTAIKFAWHIGLNVLNHTSVFGSRDGVAPQAFTDVKTLPCKTITVDDQR